MRISEKFALHEEEPRPHKHGHRHLFDARNHYPQIKHHTPPPKRGNNKNPQPPTNSRRPRAGIYHQRSRPAGLLSQSPIVCPAVSRSSVSHTTSHCLLCTKPRPLQAKGSSRHQGWPTATPFFVVLLRKEVIQPHLPVRLPCYDFVPIADPTFDGSLHKG